ncbi:Flp pilus assembly CpaF family ATPase [Murinocardiopsis flavida]|uniref:Flp pilus assembly CpaF family ATPase n=1 Tax=Murinocardiopsis flavida TaxID=645275 RepID=A0A2P8DG31_9ACTN|nr:ATPase, T2SS/T4P/T4SS family [Murinocardiopsis flavida]PSK96168.1 Flp pilus assembly CpaF family ATPase [Murinocardiopsis flavida]
MTTPNRSREPAPAAPAATVERVAAEATNRLVAAARDDEAAGRPVVVGAQYRERARTVIADVLDAMAGHALSNARPVMAPEVEEQVRRLVLARVCGLGPLEELLADPEVENIAITGAERVMVRYRGGHRAAADPVASSDAELIALVRRLAAEAASGERRWDASAPMLNLELPGGQRLAAVMALSRRPSVVIRCHPAHHLRLRDLHRAGMVEDTARDLLTAATRARLNLLISGATAAGKTTLLRALAAHIPAGERLVTIEDTFELGLDTADEGAAHPDCVALQGRPPNLEGIGEVTLADLVRQALRLSPDRVIVGETRGPETVAVLTAMSMGTDGSMATLHASSSAGVFTKLAAYTAQAQERLSLEATNLLIAAAAPLIVHIDATPDGARRVSSVREVVGAEGHQIVSNEIYRRDAETGQVTGGDPPAPATARALAGAGFDTARLVGEWIA